MWRGGVDEIEGPKQKVPLVHSLLFTNTCDESSIHLDELQVAQCTLLQWLIFCSNSLIYTCISCWKSWCYYILHNHLFYLIAWLKWCISFKSFYFTRLIFIVFNICLVVYSSVLYRNILQIHVQIQSNLP